MNSGGFMTMLCVCVVSVGLQAATVDLTIPLNADNIDNYTGSAHDINDNVAVSEEAYLTQSSAQDYSTSSGNGLPDDGIFADALGIGGFDVTLNYHNDDNGNNVLQLNQSNAAATVDLPAGQQLAYNSLYLFASNQNGNRSLSYTLHYADSSSDSGTIDTYDWFTDPTFPSGSAYLIDGMDRYRAPNGGFDNNNDPAVFGHSLAPDVNKTLLSIDLSANFTSSSQAINVFGISGDAVPEPGTLCVVIAGAGGMLLRRRRKIQ